MRYIRAASTNQVLAQIDGSGNLSWYLTDNQGSVRDIVSAAGTAVTDHIDYGAFGNIILETNSAATGRAYLYTGLAEDRDTGIVQAEHRTLLTSQGQWMEEDPERFDAGDANLRRYVGNDAVNATDVSGLFAAMLRIPNVQGGGVGAGQNGGWSFYKWLYTGDGNTADDVYNSAMAAGGEYLYAYSPIRGLYAFAGLESKTGMKGEALLLTGYSLDDGGWAGVLVGANANPEDPGPFTIAFEVTTLPNGGWEIFPLLDPMEDVPIGAFYGKEEFGIYTYKELDLGLGIEALAGIGVEFSYKNLPNLWNPDYWTGKLPLPNAAGLGECFVAGTPVLTPDGSRMIEDLKEGDLVYSRSEHDLDGPVEAKRVKKKFVNTGRRILQLHVESSVIRTTAGHPFFVHSKGWVPACELNSGDLLSSLDGQEIEVANVLNTGDVETVYNLQVTDHHTYFVGSNEQGHGVWVHNVSKMG
jgi:RHS repeat-associated protein